MLEGAKLIGAGAATIALAGAAVGIGNVFSSLIHSVARNPSLAKQLFGYAILGFALTESIALVALMMALLDLLVLDLPTLNIFLSTFLRRSLGFFFSRLGLGFWGSFAFISLSLSGVCWMDAGPSNPGPRESNSPWNSFPPVPSDLEPLPSGSVQSVPSLPSDVEVNQGPVPAPAPAPALAPEGPVLLLPENVRREQLNAAFRFSFVGKNSYKDLEEKDRIVDKAFDIETGVERALLENGFNADRLGLYRTQIREILFWGPKNLLSEKTLGKYQSDIKKNGGNLTESQAYQRLIKGLYENGIDL